jgi:predicted nucleotidyltransferase component of viral defense system
MLEPKPPKTLDISAWISKARANPTVYRQRQVTDILLNAIALTPSFGEGLYLKGGILMALAYGSPRTTNDVDFSVIGDPEEMDAIIRDTLEDALRIAAAQRGYFDILCKVQGIEKKPRPETFVDSPFPALKIRIGSALRTNPAEMTRLENGKATQVISIDLSFREPVDSVHKLVVGGGNVVQAYGLYDLIAEKLRAILQQVTRPHPGQRRQDVYDLVHLFKTFELDDQECSDVLAILRHKSRERDFDPTMAMISDERIVSKLRETWPTLKQELEEVPDFDESFKIVRSFYERLPWAVPENFPES